VIKNNKGQVSIFVIIAILVVGAIIVFFAVKGNFLVSEIPAEFLPIYNSYSECIEQEVEIGLGLMGMQGGRIEFGDYTPGSDYAPFSSHLNFFGNPVKYWYYIAGNGLIKENVPTKGDIERELEDFIESRIGDCRFDEFYTQGFYIELPEESSVNVKILDDKVEINLDSNLIVSRDGNSAKKSRHDLEVKSRLGEFYDVAKGVYDKEAESLFLEEYSLDVLRLYAPVDGVEVSCSPKVWKTREVIDEIKDGLEVNIAEIKFDSNYYSLEGDGDYFVVDEKVDVPVRFMYSKNWASKIEIYGDGVDDELMIAKQVGNQEGMGIMGFCYVPYHFVYDVSFPVMVQVGDGLEMFQFPISVIIDNNLPREAELLDLNYGEIEFDICEFKEGEVEIYTYDNNLNALESSVDYKCLDQVCSLGKTELEDGSAILKTEIPKCVNGYLIAKSEGYWDEKIIFSSNSESVADIILDKEYDLLVDVKADGLNLKDGESAIIHFIGDETRSAMLPDNSQVKLKEGNYDIEVYIYGDTGITIPASTKTQCIQVAKSGLFGFFGATEEQCFNIDIPESKIENALKGGGNIKTYILGSELETGRVMLEVQGLPKPDSLEQLQLNYEIFENLDVGIVFG